MNGDRPHPPQRNAWPDDAFDDGLRARHRDAVENVSPRVQAQLHQRMCALRTPAAGLLRKQPAWRFALAASLAVVFAFAMHRRVANDNSSPSVPPVAANASNDTGELVATLDETPDLYLWLASDDASRILSE